MMINDVNSTLRHPVLSGKLNTDVPIQAQTFRDYFGVPVIA